MSLLSVTRREWTGRQNILLLGFGLGVLQVVGMRLEPNQNSPYAFEKASFIAVATGIGFAWVVALLYGSSMVGRDLEERRFGFFLNQPLHEAQIFLGKVLAGIGIALLAGLLTSLPPIILGGVWRHFLMRDVGIAVGIALAGSLTLLLLFHAVSIQVRSHSMWLAFDLLVWSAFAGGLRWLSQRLMEAGAFPDVFHLWGAMLMGVTLGLGIAGYLQVAQGRTDLQRGHRWISVTVAITLGLMLLVAWADVGWVLKHRPQGIGSRPRNIRNR